jgi:hypothetical protein
MLTMAQLRIFWRMPVRDAFVVATLVFALGLTQGCSRSESNPTDAFGSASHTQELPFHSGVEQPSDGGTPLSPGFTSGSSLPFKAANTRILPSGTLLTVALQGSLSTAEVHAGEVFSATVAAPLSIDGETLIPKGAAVTGRVESARSQAEGPGLVPRSGYFELTLNTITLGGKPIALQTSSLFARGTALRAQVGSGAKFPGSNPGGIRVQKGRALTFRLTAPVTFDGPNSSPVRSLPGRVGE